MNDYVIEARQITKKYRSVPALNQVNLGVQPGSIYGLIGDNGAGKSTLLKLLAGHIFPTAGEIRLFGQSGERELRRCRRQMGVIIEHPGFFPNMTVERTLEYYRIQKGVPGRKKAEQIMELVGILEKRREKCKCLSLGQKQRLGLAIALLGEPALLVLDEPVNGLDPSGIVELRALLQRLNTEKRITILLSSHILSELQQTATMFGFLSGGNLLDEISAQELREKCADRLDIAVEDREKYAALLAKHFPEENWRVLPEGTIQIRGFRREPGAYSRLAMEHGLCILKLERRSASLEDYYMNLKNGGKTSC